MQSTKIKATLASCGHLDRLQVRVILLGNTVVKGLYRFGEMTNKEMSVEGVKLGRKAPR